MGTIVPGSREQVAEILARLAREYPDAECALNFTNPFELLVATILSAQTTDARVNQVTPQLFARFPDPVALAGPRFRSSRRFCTRWAFSGPRRDRCPVWGGRWWRFTTASCRERSKSWLRCRGRAQDGQRRPGQCVWGSGNHCRYARGAADAAVGVDQTDRPGEGRA